MPWYESFDAIIARRLPTLRTLRDEGLPYYHNGKSFVYDPEEVKAFLKHLWQVKKVKLKTRQENGKR